MKLSIISPFPPIKGGISKETELIYIILKETYDINIFSFSKLYPSLLYPSKNQEDKPVNNFITDKKINYSINITNPISWFTTATNIINSNSSHLLFRFWNPFFIPLYLFIINRVKRKNKKVEVLCICDNIFPHERFFFDKKFIKYFFSKIDRFLVMSTDSENKLKGIVDNEQKIIKSFLPLKFSYNKISKSIALEKLNLKKSKIILLFFGFIREYKGLELLLKSLIGMIDFDIQLIIAGQCISNKGKYEKIIDKNKLNNNVIWYDEYIPDAEVPIYFSACDVVVLPHTSISQSGIIPLAYKFNKLIIASNLLSFKENIINGKTGYLFDNNNYLSLQKTIKYVYDNYDCNTENNYIVDYSKKYSNQNLLNDFNKFLNI